MRSDDGAGREGAKEGAKEDAEDEADEEEEEEDEEDTNIDGAEEEDEGPAPPVKTSSTSPPWR